MNNNGSFGEENKILIKPIEKGDIAEDEKITNKKIKNQTNKNDKINNNEIFSSLPLEMKMDNEYLNSNNIYDNLLSMELLKFHLSNVFNIIKRKSIIINAKTFYFLKKISNSKINKLIQAEILFLKLSSSFIILSKILKKNRLTKVYYVLCKLKNKSKINDIFKLKFEMLFKKDKDNIINENNNKIKTIERENKEMERKIKNLNSKDNDLKNELNNLIKKERQLSEKIKFLEYSKNANNSNIMKQQQTSNISSINNNSKCDSDLLTLEGTIETNKQIKEKKEDIIKKFIFKMNDLLNEYKEYIDKLNSTNGINPKGEKVEISNSSNSNSNKQSLNQKDKCGLGNTWYSSKFSGNHINEINNNSYNK